MRGRTNVTQRATPYVNGEVITAEVETGSVNAGDFVEYKTVNSSGTYMDENLGEVYNQFYYGDYYLVESIKNSNGYLKLYDKFGNLLDNLIYPSSVNFQNLSKLENNLFVFTCGSNNTSVKFVLLNIDTEKNQINVLDEYKAAKREIGIASLLSKEKQYFISPFGIASPMKFQIYSYKNNKIELVKTIEYSSGSDFGYYEGGYDNSSTSKLLKYLEENKLVFFAFEQHKYSSASTSYKYKNFYVVFHVENDESIVVDTKAVTINSSGSTSRRNYIDLGKNIVCVWDSSLLRVFTYDNNAFLELGRYDLANMHSDINQANSYAPSIKSSFENILTISGVFYLISKNSRYFCQIIMEYDENKNSVAFSNLLIASANYLSVATQYCFCLKDGDNIHLYYDYNSTKSYYINTNYKNKILSNYKDTNYVKKYTGENAIGFAKTSGNQGEEVRIYIPKVS